MGDGAAGHRPGLCNFLKPGSQTPRVQRQKEGGARPTLKGSLCPAASPDWELLKEHLEHGRLANPALDWKTNKFIPPLPLVCSLP